MYAHGIKFGVSKGSVGGTLVDITGGETYVATLFQEYVMCNGKEPVKLQGGGYATAAIMEF